MQKIWTLVSSKVGRSVVAVGVLALLGVGAVNLDHRTLRQRADAWAKSHAGTTATLEELAAFPADYRQAMFDALPAAEKSRLWHVQLQRVLDTEPNLTGDQRAFLVKVMAMATPASFEKDVPTPVVCPDIARLFTNPNQRERVRKIAAGVTPARSMAATWVRVSESVRSAVSTRAADFDCNCYGLGLCECALVAACIDGPCNANNNCGCIWSGPCDKLCQAAIPSMNTVVK